MVNHIADNTMAIEAVTDTYPEITEEQTNYIALASLSAAKTLVEDGGITAVENAREDNESEEGILDLYTMHALTESATYEIVRDIARIVMHTWHVASKYGADSFGYHFVMTRNEEGVSFNDDERFPDGGYYLDFVTRKMFMPWHVDADENGVTLSEG